MSSMAGLLQGGQQHHKLKWRAALLVWRPQLGACLPIELGGYCVTTLMAGFLRCAAGHREVLLDMTEGCWQLRSPWGTS